MVNLLSFSCKYRMNISSLTHRHLAKFNSLSWTTVYACRTLYTILSLPYRFAFLHNYRTCWTDLSTQSTGNTRICSPERLPAYNKSLKYRIDHITLQPRHSCTENLRFRIESEIQNNYVYLQLLQSVPYYLEP